MKKGYNPTDPANKAMPFAKKGKKLVKKGYSKKEDALEKKVKKS